MMWQYPEKLVMNREYRVKTITKLGGEISLETALNDGWQIERVDVASEVIYYILYKSKGTMRKSGSPEGDRE